MWQRSRFVGLSVYTRISSTDLEITIWKTSYSAILTDLSKLSACREILFIRRERQNYNIWTNSSDWTTKAYSCHTNWPMNIKFLYSNFFIYERYSSLVATLTFFFYFKYVKCIISSNLNSFAVQYTYMYKHMPKYVQYPLSIINFKF